MTPEGILPEERLRRAREQKRKAIEERPRVESLVTRLKGHWKDNHFVERLLQQLDDTRRQA